MAAPLHPMGHAVPAWTTGAIERGDWFLFGLRRDFHYPHRERVP